METAQEHIAPSSTDFVNEIPEKTESPSSKNARNEVFEDDMKTDDAAITRKPSDYDVKISNENKNKPSDEIPPSAEAILRTPRISTMPRSLTDVPLSNFLISQLKF